MPPKKIPLSKKCYCKKTDDNEEDEEEEERPPKFYKKNSSKQTSIVIKGMEEEDEEEEEEIFEEEEEEEEAEEENEDITDSVVIKLKSAAINVNYSILAKYLHLIREKYLYNDIQSKFSSKIQGIQQNYHINDENIIFFFNNLGTKDINITNNQYFDLFQLAKYTKAKIFLSKLKKYFNCHQNDIDFMIEKIFNEKLNHKTNKSFCNCLISNTMITQHINECLQNDKFKSLPIKTINKIFQNSSGEISSDLLYEFIIPSIDRNYILFPYINLATLSDDKLQFHQMLFN